MCLYFFLLLTMSKTTELTTEALIIILDKKLEENLRPFHRAMDDLRQALNDAQWTNLN